MEQLIPLLIAYGIFFILIYIVYKLFTWFCMFSFRLVERIKNSKVEPRYTIGYVTKWTLLIVFGPIWLLTLIFLVAIPFINMYCAATAVRDWWHADKE